MVVYWQVISFLQLHCHLTPRTDRARPQLIHSAYLILAMAMWKPVILFTVLPVFWFADISQTANYIFNVNKFEILGRTCFLPLPHLCLQSRGPSLPWFRKPLILLQCVVKLKLRHVQYVCYLPITWESKLWLSFEALLQAQALILQPFVSVKNKVYNCLLNCYKGFSVYCIQLICWYQTQSSNCYTLITAAYSCLQSAS